MGDTYDTLIWQDPNTTAPAKADVDKELVRVKKEYAAKEYQKLRAAEYPPITDYLDGVVKGDQAQIDAYIAACQAVKTKYPK